MANAKQELFGHGRTVSHCVEESVALGRSIGEELVVGSVISLEGTLGAGKTQIAKGIASGLGCDTTASSPSFALLHEYGGGRLPLFHFDFYRLEEESELLTAGYDDCLAEGATIVEWGDRFPEALPPDALRLRIEIQSDGDREIIRLPR